MKNEHIVSYTIEELRAMQARGETRSDFDRAARLSVPDGSDPDDAIDPSENWQVATELPFAIRAANVRIDEDVLDWFRAQGQGYETKINEVLRDYFLGRPR